MGNARGGKDSSRLTTFTKRTSLARLNSALERPLRMRKDMVTWVCATRRRIRRRGGDSDSARLHHHPTAAPTLLPSVCALSGPRRPFSSFTLRLRAFSSLNQVSRDPMRPTRVLCVAEKPSIAKSITQILSGGQFATVYTTLRPATYDDWTSFIAAKRQSIYTKL